MTWSIGKSDVPAADVDQAIEELELPEQNVYARAEMAAQLEAAKKSIRDLIDSGALGTFEPNGKVYLSAGGHSNPNHKPEGGWSGTDFITVTVSYSPPQPEPEPAKE